MKCYWWKNGPTTNFGDELSYLLLSHFSNIQVERADPTTSDIEIVSTGSVLDILPTRWTGIVAGSGQLHASTRRDLSAARVFGLRGEFSARFSKLSKTDRANLVVGDPGLLASELAPVESLKYELGIVPHWSDTELFPKELAASRRYRYAEPILIDPTGDPKSVITKIGSCKKVVASSLHGLIVADSFGIPRRAECFPRMSSPYEGGKFKFADYASSIRQPIQFGTLQTAPTDRIFTLQTELFEMFNEIGRFVNG